MRYEFVEHSPVATIKVFGIGGAGGNAINNMIAADVKGVDFIAANTDKQALELNAARDKLQLGMNITNGLGAGADPEKGAAAAEENLESIKAATQDVDMVFITAGMGGGTGTGASPIIAREARGNGALTVAVVTKPFDFEGEKRMKTALDGIEKLKREVDTLLVIPNQRLRALGNKDTPFLELMKMADDVLLYAVKGISDLITVPGFINLDFADVKRVMEQMGTALMGTGIASGESRAVDAAQMAINSPLLEDISIDQARGVLINITGSAKMTMDEVMEGSSFVKNEVHPDAEIIWGMVFDDSMAEELRITVIATGIGGGRDGKVVNLREISPDEADELWTVRVKEDLDKPTFQRQFSEEDHDRLRKKTGFSKEKKGLLNKLFQKDDLDYPTFLRKQAD
ncbi:MAG: cell division protein FtsZ [Deltaproteobacteria bacterium]|nr:cell division protein FtsZ [Deltaproteobacteria bacterium]MBW2076149.1 cell division protein FtsZ [Deltaproteobacteria bacterium]MBW2310756.1 cell division protein FtsZ [Deltaproteobacteria bacterium]RLB31146.1 MAG: cell division protein FtsZ [Deltaproteobacteria bacterium]